METLTLTLSIYISFAVLSIAFIILAIKNRCLKKSIQDREGLHNNIIATSKYRYQKHAMLLRGYVLYYLEDNPDKEEWIKILGPSLMDEPIMPRDEEINDLFIKLEKDNKNIPYRVYPPFYFRTDEYYY